MEEFLLDPTTTTLARLQAFILIFIRITGVFQRLPVISGGTVPLQVRIFLSFMIAVVVYNVVMGNQATPIMPQSLGIFLIAVLVEWGIGLFIGFIGGLLLTGLQMGGRLVDDQMGFSLANVVDPQTNETMSISGQIVYLTGTLLFVVLGGFNMLIIVMVQSFDIVPLLGFNLSDHVIWHIVTETMPQTFTLAVAFAAPAICVVLLSTVALGLIGKVVPEMNIFAFSFGIRVFLGLIMLYLTMSLLPGLASLILEGTEYYLRASLHYLRGGG